MAGQTAFLTGSNLKPEHNHKASSKWLATEGEGRWVRVSAIRVDGYTVSDRGKGVIKQSFYNTLDAFASCLCPATTAEPLSRRSAGGLAEHNVLLARNCNNQLPMKNRISRSGLVIFKEMTVLNVELKSVHSILALLLFFWTLNL